MPALTECLVLPQRARKLPAGFGHARNEPLRGVFAEGDSGQAESAHECPTPSGCRAAVDESRRTGIPREHRETDVVFFSFQLLTQLCVLAYGLLFALVALGPAFLCHR